MYNRSELLSEGKRLIPVMHKQHGNASKPHTASYKYYSNELESSSKG
jgi:hypothetical protein